MYGSIANESWRDDEITPRQFANDLKSLGAINTLTVRINSGGGDVFAAQTIGNLLESMSAETICRIDGLCASAATIIACHCDKVISAADGCFMIHNPAVGLCDYCTEDDLQAYINELQVVKNSIITLYAKKTGRDETELADEMNATSWFTAAEAMERGFVDEVETGEAPTYEDRAGALFVNSVDVGVRTADAPNFVRNGLLPKSKDCFSNTKIPAAAPEHKEETQTMAENKNPGAAATEPTITTADALRTAYPDLVNQIERACAQTAAATERARIKDIMDMTVPGGESMAQDAMFGETTMTAEQFAVAAMKAAKAQGASYLAAAQQDAQQSGVQNVAQTTPAQTTHLQDGVDEIVNVLQDMNKK